MHQIITSQLKEIEATENVRILHAVESGSRAWGFASPDSDYDVRFIYVRDVSDYLKLDEFRDVIEWRQDDILDINGWDLRKALRLLYKSNPTLFEWNKSPIIYKTTDEWKAISHEINNYFLMKAGLYHYLSTTTGNYRKYLKGETVKLKKYFYVVRPLLACKWILDKKCPPSMLFSELVASELEPDMQPIINDLLEMKANTTEFGEGKRIDILNAYIDKKILQLKEVINNLPSDNKNNWDRLNKLFLLSIRYLKNGDNHEQ